VEYSPKNQVGTCGISERRFHPRGPAGGRCGSNSNSCHFRLCHLSALRAHGELRARIPDLVAPRLPRPYHFRARIQYYQYVVAPFPGDSVLPSGPFSPRSRQTERPRLKKIDDQPRRSPPGRGVRAVEGGHGVGSGDPRYVAGQSEERTTLALFQKEISLRIFARLPQGRIRERARSVN
jgi:hypothetical protein